MELGDSPSCDDVAQMGEVVLAQLTLTAQRCYDPSCSQFQGVLPCVRGLYEEGERSFHPQ